MRASGTPGEASSPRPASVLALRLHDARQRERLEALLRDLLPLWPAAERVVLEAPEGAVIVALGHPATAKRAAQQAAGEDGLSLGLHHGPVAGAETPEGLRFTGEGISGAQVASLAGTGQLTITSAFEDALRAAPPPQAQRRRTVVGLATIAGLLAVGGAVRLGREAYEAARRPAIVQLDIRPQGEIWVDGELKGQSPPLTRLWIPAGPHVIEVKNSRFRPLRMEVNLKPGEEIEIKHAFAGPRRQPAQQAQPGPFDRFKFWQR